MWWLLHCVTYLVLYPKINGCWKGIKGSSNGLLFVIDERLLVKSRCLNRTQCCSVVSFANKAATTAACSQFSGWLCSLATCTEILHCLQKIRRIKKGLGSRPIHQLHFYSPYKHNRLLIAAHCYSLFLKRKVELLSKSCTVIKHERFVRHHFEACSPHSNAKWQELVSLSWLKH